MENESIEATYEMLKVLNSMMLSNCGDPVIPAVLEE